MIFFFFFTLVSNKFLLQWSVEAFLAFAGWQQPWVSVSCLGFYLLCFRHWHVGMESGRNFKNASLDYLVLWWEKEIKDMSGFFMPLPSWQRVLLQKGWPEMRVAAWDSERAALGWERWWCEPGQLVAKQHHARRCLSPVGPCLNQAPPSTDCIAGLGTASLLCFAFNCNAIWKGLCLLPTDIPGAGVPTGPTASFSLHNCSALVWEENVFWTLEETSCVWLTADDLASCIA